MRLRPHDLPDGLLDRAGGARPRRRGRRLRDAALRRAHAHPGQPRHAEPARRRAAGEVLAHARPVRGARHRRAGDASGCGSAPASAWSSSATRSSPPRRSPRSTSLSGGRFEFGVGGGWNREEMRNHGTDPRRRFSIMRERVAGHEGDLDAGRGGVPRRVRRLRPDLVVAEAGAEAAPAGPRRRPRREGARPRARVRRRVDAEPRRARRTSRRASPSCASGPAATCRSATTPRRPRTSSSSASPRPASTARCSTCPSEGADTVLPLVERYAELAARHR